jgi:hypothetical protein
LLLFTRRPSFQQILADLQRMATKLSLAGCDSASSLPMQQACMPQQQQQMQQQQQLQPNPPQQQQQGSAVTGGGIDPTRLHNWQPQTSLLDSRTNDSTGGSSLNPGNISGPVVGNAASDAQQQQMQQPHDSMSWGMQSAGGGLWLGGEFAPSNMPSDIDLPPVPHGDEPVPAMPGLQEALAAAAAAQQQQQMRLQSQQQQGGHLVQWPGLAGPAAQQQQQVQLQAHAVQQQGGNVVQWPGLAGPAAAAAQQQQQQQQSGQPMQVNGTWQEPSSIDPSAYANSLSTSSGVYLEGSSTVEEGCLDEGGLGGMPAAAAAAAEQGLGGGAVQGRLSNNMATIAEETEHLTSGTGAAVGGTAAAAAAVSNRV